MKRIMMIRMAAVCAAVVCMFMTGACDDNEQTVSAVNESVIENVTEEDAADKANTAETADIGTLQPDQDHTEGLGETFSGDTVSPSEQSKTDADETEDDEESVGEDDREDNNSKDVDLIFFMGQSNMSGAGGDASLAPYVPVEAGEEFRAVSDPSKLYPITEPFGINENNLSGLHEFPEAKKGSLVSSFINKYHELTGRKVIAVSMSMGATDMDVWITPGVAEDVKQRLDTSVKFLRDNGYNIGYMYALWLHGESDAIDHTDPAVYKTCLDDVMRPLFIGGVRKVFIIMPGRTIDYKDIFRDIINVQKEICAESDYYAVATTILTKVSTEYMLDQYHYNQHVLNMVGIESAKAVAYYTEHSTEKIVYDYKEGKNIVPEGVEPDSQGEIEHIDLSQTDINAEY